jgi:hypothetical protein
MNTYILFHSKELSDCEKYLSKFKKDNILLSGDFLSIGVNEKKKRFEVTLKIKIIKYDY